MKKFLLFAETCFAIFGLLFFTGAVALGGRDGIPSGGGLVPEAVMMVFRYFVWFGSSLLVLLNGKRTLITMRRDWLLWIFVLLVLLSFTWSEFPMWTLLTNREMLQMTTFGLYFATRFDLKQQVRLVAMTFAIGAIASILIAIGMPAVGRHTVIHVGAWRGVFGDKNIFGSMMVLGSLAFYSLPIERSFDRWFKFAGIGTCFALILLSTSKTALILFIALLLLLTFYRNFRWHGKISVAFGSLSVLVIGSLTVGLLSNWATIITQIGRDPTLTGRTYIWQVGLTRLLDRPFFGFGRSSFWAPESIYPKEVNHFLSVQFNAAHVHNGFLETALDVGIIGLALFLICFGTAFVIALKRAYRTRSPEQLWSLGFLIFLAINNMTESLILRLANIYWVLFVATVLTLKQRVPIEEEEPEALPSNLQSYRPQ